MDEMTIEQRRAIALANARLRMQQQTEGIPQQRQAAPTTTRVLSESPFKALAGAADVMAEAPLNVYNLGKAAFGTAATALGRPDLAPEVTPSPSMFYKMGQKAGIISPDEVQAQMTPGQRYLDVGLQGGLSALAGRPSVAGMAKTAATGAAASMTGQGVGEATGSPVAGILAGSLVPAAATGVSNKMATQRMATQNALAAGQEQNAVMQNTLRSAQQEGFAVPQSYYTPGQKPGFAERAAGGIEKEVSIANQAKANDLSRKALGLEKNAPLTDESMKAIRKQEFDTGYEPIKSVGKIYGDEQYGIDLKNIQSQYGSVSNSFPKAAKDEVKRLVEAHYERSFDSADAMKRISSLREDASGNFQNGNTGLAKAQKAIANALEDRIERKLAGSGNPSDAALLDNFKEARKRIAMSHAVGDSIVKGTGSVDTAKLASQLDQGLTGELRTIGEFANAAPNLFPDRANIGSLRAKAEPGIPGAKMANLAARVGGLTAGGSYFGGPGGALAGGFAAITPELVATIARNRALAASRSAPQLANSLRIPMREQSAVNMLAPTLPLMFQQPGQQ